MNIRKKNTVLICSNYAWTILNFRLSLIKSLKKSGYRVVVLTQYDGSENRVQRYVDEMRPLFISRKGINPFVDAITLFDLIKHFFSIKPDYLFLFTIKPVIYGALAAKFFKFKTIITITGLGTAFIANNWLTKLVQTLYRYSLSSINLAFFQNDDDRNIFIECGLIKPDVCKLVPGSGIDTTHFSYLPLPLVDNTTFLLIARMLWDKGVGEYVEAAKIIKRKYPDTKFQLLGPLGVENRTCISTDTMADWVSEKFVEYLGEADDVRPYIETASCIVLPSYREGTSRVLLEAASMGRPVVATDVPGCREVLDDGITGFLCKSKDCIDLSKKIEIYLNLTADKRKIMGVKAREKVVRQFDQEIVNQLYIDALFE